MAWLGSWLSHVFGRRSAGEDLTVLKLRTTRFRQLLRSYGQLLSLLEDAAEKQGGGFVLDRQYVVAVAESVSELADAIAYDLNVLTGQGHLPFYAAADRFRASLRALAIGSQGTPAVRRGSEATARAGAAVSPAALAAALARAEVLYQENGRVACRGVAAGRVVNLEEAGAPSSVPPGTVLVAGDVDGERAAIAVGRAAAILLDHGGAAGTGARLARELRIPAIVDLHDASARLRSGTEVTVDADENVIYRGRVEALVEYDRAARADAEEEEEYHLLRAVREAAFPLTVQRGAAEPELALAECRTVRDLVHLAHRLAGDALRDLLARELEKAALLGGAPPWCDARFVALEGAPSGGQQAGSAELASRPLRAFVEGMSASRHDQEPPPGARALRAAARDEHAIAVLSGPLGFDLFDAVVGGGGESNFIYCRFTSGGENDEGASRGAFAVGVLSRLGFATALTEQEATGWLRGLPGDETERQVRTVGSLFAHLARPVQRRPGAKPAIDAFLRDRA